MKYFRIFGSKCYIKRDEDLGRFDPRCDERIFLGYSSKSKAYKCYNTRLRKIVESANVKVDEGLYKQEKYHSYESDDEEENQIVSAQTQDQNQNGSVEQIEEDAVDDEVETQKTATKDVPKTLRYVKLNHSENQIIGERNSGVKTRARHARDEICLTLQVEPKNVEAYKDESWINAMKEELE